MRASLGPSFAPFRVIVATCSERRVDEKPPFTRPFPSRGPSMGWFHPGEVLFEVSMRQARRDDASLRKGGVCCEYCTGVARVARRVFCAQGVCPSMPRPEKRTRLASLRWRRPCALIFASFVGRGRPSLSSSQKRTHVLVLSRSPWCWICTDWFLSTRPFDPVRSRGGSGVSVSNPLLLLPPFPFGGQGPELTSLRGRV